LLLRLREKLLWLTQAAGGCVAVELNQATSGGRNDEPHLTDSPGIRLAPAGFSTNGLHPSAGDAGRQGLFSASELPDDMDLQPRTFRQRHLPDLGMALKSILAFWLLYIVLLTLRGVVVQFPDFWSLLLRRGVAAIVGAGLTFLVYLAMRPLAAMNLTKKAVLTGLICLPASIAYAACNHAIFYIIAPLDAAKLDPRMKAMTPFEQAAKMIAEGTLSWYFLFAAWAAVYVAMSYAAQLRAADLRAAAFERQAQEAQLRALRYQINPHFLFNTLNSLSSLILSQKTEVAERMIMNLSTFFRTTLSADPTADVPLEEEIRLQRLYLDIEQIRFPERLKVEIDIPDSLRSARVPVLILQPIVENAIKYGVARSRRPVTLRISAVEEAGRLHLKVKDDGEQAPSGAEYACSTGVGLANVCDRLIARYGTQAGCFHGPDPEGGFTVHVILPVVRND
jgi:LytS/YehU family sensor histidine kinase